MSTLLCHSAPFYAVLKCGVSFTAYLQQLGFCLSAAQDIREEVSGNGSPERQEEITGQMGTSLTFIPLKIQSRQFVGGRESACRESVLTLRNHGFI